MCTVSPRTGWRWASFSTTGVAADAVHAQVQHRARPRQRQAQLARVDVEAQRLPVPAVQDPRHAAGAAQAPGRTRA